MKIRTIVNAHLGRERLDALIAVLVPFVLMVESGYACGWVFADGDLSLTSPNTYWSLARGLFLEGLIYAVFKLVRMFVMHPKRLTRLLAIIPLTIGCMAMSVSAGMNLAWINRSGEMVHIVSMVSQFMPLLLVNLFKPGLGLLFPLSVGAFAIFDLSKLIEEVLHSAHLEHRAFLAENAELHRKEMKKAQKEAVKEVASQYQQMAKVNIGDASWHTYVDAVALFRSCCCGSWTDHTTDTSCSDDASRSGFWQHANHPDASTPTTANRQTRLLGKSVEKSVTVSCTPARRHASRAERHKQACTPSLVLTFHIVFCKERMLPHDSR